MKNQRIATATQITITADKLESMFANNGYSNTRVLALRFIDMKSNGWYLFEVKLSGQFSKTSSRAFADFSTGKAWPIAKLNCENLAKAGR